MWVAALKIVKKLYSKLYKIMGAITDGGVWGRLRREMIQNLVQNYTRKKHEKHSRSMCRALREQKQRLFKPKKQGVLWLNELFWKK
jgi:hypothetical protein